MIENNNEVSKDLEKALQVLKQAQQRVANEKKTEREETQSREPPQNSSPALFFFGKKKVIPFCLLVEGSAPKPL